MNAKPFENHFRNLSVAKSMIGKLVIGQRPGTFDRSNSVRGIAKSVRECITDYGDHRPVRILVDIEHCGTVTPCEFESVTAQAK